MIFAQACLDHLLFIDDDADRALMFGALCEPGALLEQLPKCLDRADAFRERSTSDDTCHIIDDKVVWLSYDYGNS